MPSNKYALIRYRVIDRKISNKYKPYPSIEDLVDECSDVLGLTVSRSTIEKDIRAMKKDTSLGFDAPIAYSKKYEGYYYTDSNYTIRDVPLNDEEIDAIQFAARTLFQFKSIPIFQQYETAIDKILDRVLVGSGDKNETEKVIQFESLPMARGNEFLNLLMGAIQNRKTVQFDYKSYKKQQAKPRIVDPYLLKEYRHRWYLIGYSEEKRKVIVYGLDRIAHLVVLNESFEIQKEFNPDLFFKYSFGITTSDTDPETIQLKVNEVLSKYLISQPLHHSQKVERSENNFTIFSYKLVVTYELVERIMGFGPEAEVIKPQLLKDQLIQRLNATLNLYKR